LLIVETREFAEEGLKLVQSKLGTTAYIEQSNVVRQDVLGKRHDRKMKRSLEAVRNPETAAKKRIRQHEKVYTSIEINWLSRGEIWKREKFKSLRIGVWHMAVEISFGDEKKA
jgi:hypothetical protein